MNWAAYPFLRITLAMASGILINNVIKWDFILWNLLLLFLVTIFIFYLLSSLNTHIKINKVLQGVTGLLVFALLGYCNAQLRYFLHAPDISPNSEGSITNYTLVIQSRPDFSKNSIKYHGLIDQVKRGNKWEKISDQAIVYFIDDIPERFDYGETLLIKGNPNFIKDNTNPNAFNYAGHMQTKGIYLVDYVLKDDFVHVKKMFTYSLKYWAFELGNYFESILSKYIRTEREQSMAKAMIIGQKEDISAEMNSVYQTTGTSHILAVSGLHVGIIFLFFGLVFKFLDKKRTKWIYHAILLVSIWSYAFVTGLSPSVSRAAIMLSFVTLAILSGRKSTFYNTILASAFALLLYSPELIYSVSFQLSYAAVFGIIFLYRNIYILLFIKSKPMNFLWKITAVAISVQLVTFPITIYYFNQFPVLFAITNLFAIPTATIVIIGGLALLLTSFLPVVPGIIGYVLQSWIYIYNEIMAFLSSFDFSTINNLYLKPYHVILLLICVLLLLKFIQTKSLSYFRNLTLALLIFTLVELADNYIKSHQAEIIFYDMRSTCSYDVFLGKSCYTNTISSVDDTTEEIRYNITPNRKHHLISNIFDIDELETSESLGNNRLICLKEKSILILKDLHNLSPCMQHLPIDYLVVGKTSISDLDRITECFKIGQLILDNTISIKLYYQHANHLKKVSNIHSIAKDGAYLIHI